VSEQIGQLRDHWATVDGRAIYAHASEGAPTPGRLPIVMAHGLLVSSRSMVPAARRLAAHYPVYALDLPGYGKSVRPTRIQGVAELSGVLDRWMAAVGLGRAILIANSFGCQVATDFALRYPARVERLVLVGPTVDPRHRTALGATARLLLDGAREPLTYAPIIMRDVWDIGPRRALGMARVCLADRIETRLPRIEVPTLVVRGARDPLAPQRWGEEAARLLPRGRLLVIPGAAHVAHYDAVDRFVPAVQPFLDEASPQPSPSLPAQQLLGYQFL